MSRPRFLADHDLNEHIIDGLLHREPAIEFVRIHDLANREAPDSEVLRVTVDNEMIVVSHDVNTMIVHARNRIASGDRMTGLLMDQQSQPIAAVVESLLLIWSASEADEWNGAIRLLPL